MKRWLLPLLLVIIVGGALLYRATRATTQSQPPSSVVHDPDAIKAIEAAMKTMGHEGKSFTGQSWAAEGCMYYNYLVRPGVENAEPFFFVGSPHTVTRFLRASELDRVLKQHVPYDGKFLGIPRGLGDGNEQYSLGSTERDGELVFVYVGFDETACGLTVDEVAFWSPRVNETIKLNLQLVP